MGLLKMLGKLAVIGVVGMVVLTIVGKVRQAQAKAAPSAANASAAGFVMLKPEEAKNSSVVIMSPPNCPSQEAQRARALASALASAGIPHRVESKIEFSFTDMKEAERVQKFMAAVENPLVLVRGRGQGNPTLEAVVAEYRSVPGR